MLADEIVRQAVLNGAVAAIKLKVLLLIDGGAREVPAPGLVPINRAAFPVNARLALRHQGAFKLSTMPLPEAVLTNLTTALSHITDMQLHIAIMVCNDGDADIDDAAAIVGGRDAGAVVVDTPAEVGLLVEGQLLVAADARAPAEGRVERGERGPAARAGRADLRAQAGARGGGAVAGREVGPVVLQGVVVDRGRDVLGLDERAAHVGLVHEPVRARGGEVDCLYRHQDWLLKLGQNCHLCCHHYNARPM